MIIVLRRGGYKLIETRGHVKILTLDDETYAWIVAQNIGEILVVSHNPHHTDHILATGMYRLYQVEDETGLSDQQHLELNVGARLWQGYLLPAGLPDDEKKRGRIIPTREVVSVMNRAVDMS